MPSRQVEHLLFDDADAKVAPPGIKTLASAASLRTPAIMDHVWMSDLEPSVMNRRLSFDFLLDFMVITLNNSLPAHDIIGLIMQLQQSSHSRWKSLAKVAL